MKKTLLIVMLAVLFGVNSNAQIISQYIETNSGTTPKGIEVWNSGATDIDFSATNLEIEVQSNSNSSWTSAIVLNSGTLPAGHVLVVGTSDMETVETTTGCSSFVMEPFSFNGDDAIRLVLDGTVTDVFGDPSTTDPGSSWSGGGVSTRNSSIQLKSGITTGDLDGWTNPSERFEVASTDNSLVGFGVPPGGCPVVMPVEFTTIRATKNVKSVDLAWQTASELNNEMFVVERSKDGINFTAIGEVEGQGTSTRIQNYLLTDDAPLTGVSYYRVKQVDFDGAYDYSEMVSVTMDVKSIRVTPTATYDITTIYAEESTEIVVYDMTGATVTNMLPQNGQYDVDLSNAAKGIYMAVISYGTHTETVKLIRL